MKKSIQKIALCSFFATFGLALNINAETSNFTINEITETKKKVSLDKDVVFKYDGYTYKTVTSGTPKATTNDVNSNRYYEFTDGYGRYRSYFKKAGNYWYHYKNEELNSYNTLSTVVFYKNLNNCKAGNPQGFSCTQKTASDSSKSRIYSETNIYDYNKTSGSFSYKNVYIYGNNDFKTALGQYTYNGKNQITSRRINKLNSVGNISSRTSESRSYHKNGALKTSYKIYYKGQYTYNGAIEKNYNSKKKRTYYAKIYKNYKTIYREQRTYFSGTKLKSKRVLKKNTKGVDTAGYYTVYKKNGKKSYYKRLYYKKGKAVKMLYYKFNKKGQLKSNKYGKAYRYVTTIKNGYYVKKVTKAQYNKKGKLSKAKKVKVTKATRTF